MNELALIFDRLNISTADVLAAAGTKWNFLRFQPGLVGGHCIGVDPYYLTAKAEESGYHPQVILAGRRINDSMGAFVAQKLVKMLGTAGKEIKGSRVAVLGLTFKEDVPDLRNSKVHDIITELQNFGIQPMVHDPLASPEEAHEEYSISLCEWKDIRGLDAVIIAVPHRQYRTQGIELTSMLKNDGILLDLKSILPRSELPRGLKYWTL